MYKCINRAITLYFPKRFVKKKIQILLQLHRHKHHTTPTTAYCYCKQTYKQKTTSKKLFYSRTPPSFPKILSVIN